MMDDASKQAIREHIAASIGAEKYNRLIESIPTTLKKGRLRYWQEEIFKRLVEENNITIASLDDYLNIFVGTTPLKITFPSLLFSTHAESNSPSHPAP